jgi:hypothetical protein
MIFASPGHLMNHFRVNGLEYNINTKLLTQYVFKGIENVKGVKLSYREWDVEHNEELAKVYKKIKSLTRSGKGYIMGMRTPLDYYEDVIRPLLNKTSDPVKEAIQRAVDAGIGTEKDFKELIKGEE